MRRIDIQDSADTRHVVDGRMQILDTDLEGSPERAAVSVVSRSADRTLLEIARASEAELSSASNRYADAAPLVRCLAGTPLSTINNVMPVVDQGHRNGEFRIGVDGCTSLEYGKHSITIHDYCPTCEADCAELYEAIKRLRAVRARLNAVKDTLLPYGQIQFDNRQAYARNRFADVDAAVKKANKLLLTYVEIVNMLNFVVFMRNKATTSGSLREDPAGFTVQLVRALPGLKDKETKLEATIKIEPDDVYNEEKTSLLVIEENAKLEMTYQDGTQSSSQLEVHHDAPLVKTMKSGTIAVDSSMSSLARLTVSVVPFIYIKAKDTTGKDVGFENIGKGDQVDTDQDEDDRFVYKNKDLKVGLDITEDAEQLEEATVADYNESKLYPTQNIEGTDRWKFTCTWLLKTDTGEISKSERFYFEVSRVKQPVYDLVNDSTWITKIEAK